MAITETGNATNSATTGTAVSVAHSLTINAGNVIVFQVHANRTTTQTITDNNGAYAPTEHIQENTADGSARYAIYSRVAGASEPATYQWTLSEDNRWSVQIRVFSGVNNTTPWDVIPSASTRNGGVSTALTAPTMTISTAGAMGIVLGIADHNIATFSSSTNGYGTEIEPATPGQSQVSYIRIWATTGSTGTTGVTSSASTSWFAHQVALKPIVIIPIAMKHYRDMRVQ